MKVPSLLKTYALPISASVYLLVHLGIHHLVIGEGLGAHRDLRLTMMDSFMQGSYGMDDSEDEENPEWWIGRESDEYLDITDGLRGPYDPNFDDNITWPFRRANNVHIYFVHVGKAGGRSLYDKLNVRVIPFRARCRMNSKRINNPKCYGNRRRSRNMPAVARRILGHIHVHNPKYMDDEREWLRDNTNLLLVTVRDPIDRIKSAFNFHHNNFFEQKIKDRHEGVSRFGLTIFIDCFREVEDLARAVLNATGTTKRCHSIAMALLEGRAKKDPMPHFKYNYNYYMHQVWSNRPKAIAVLRTEHQWEDLARVESFLDGRPSRFLKPEKQVIYTHGSETFQLQSELSSQGAKALCCVLHREIQIHHDLVTAAVNLKGSEKLETLGAVLAHCGVNETLSPAKVWEWRWKAWYDESCHEVERLRPGREQVVIEP